MREIVENLGNQKNDIPILKRKAEIHHDYLVGLSDDKRAALEKLRRTIRVEAPWAEECSSYQLPPFRLDGKVLVLFGATAKPCSFFPGSGRAVAVHKGDLEAYSTSKSMIRFDAARLLPATLIRKIVKYRISKIAAQYKHAAHDTAHCCWSRACSIK